MIFALTTFNFAETVPPGSTPVWVVFMIAFLVLALFVWGVISSSGALGSSNTTTDSGDSHHDTHDDHH